MITKITKRDGRIVAFDASKILGALSKAVERSEEDVPLGQLTDEVVSVLNSRFNNKDNKASVEATQDIIEELLIKHNFPKTAKEYITYRAHRNEVREAKTRLMSTIRSITFQDAKDSDVKRENANIDGDTAMGTMLKYGSETAKDFYLSTLIDKDIAKAHISGDIHIHDLDFYTLTLTCCQIDLLKLFHNGFSTGHGFLREPNDIRSYAALACIAIQADQNDMHGGQAVPNFDFSMAEGVRKSFTKIFRNNTIKFSNFIRETESDVDYTESMKAFFKDLVNKNAGPKYLNKESYDQTFNALKESYPEVNFDRIKKDIIKDSELEIKEQTYQAMEALIHNLNTMHSRAGAQVPFSSLNYGTDTSEEGRLVVSCLLDTTIAGLGDGETPIFPIQIFKVKEGVNYNPGDKNYDLFQKAILCSAKRLFPNFSFMDSSFNKPYFKGDYNTEVGYMGCRTRVIGNVVDEDKAVTPGRGNLSFTSINLPRLGIKHGIVRNDETDMKGFYEELGELMDLVKDQLLERFEIQCNKRLYNFPFLLGQGVWIDSDKLKPNDRLRKILKHGTLSIGFIGLAECLKALIGKHHGESDEAQKLGLEIIEFMRNRCDEYAKEYKLNFTLLATPAEGLSGRFVNIDKAVYGKIKGVTDREGPYHKYTNAGHISYIELDGDTTNNLEAFEKIIRLMYENDMGYAAINHPVDRDPVCGYVGVIGDVCPGCGRKAYEGVPIERVNDYKNSCNC